MRSVLTTDDIPRIRCRLVLQRRAVTDSGRQVYREVRGTSRILLFSTESQLERFTEWLEHLPDRYREELQELSE